MNRAPQDKQSFRVQRSLWLISILTVGSLYAIRGEILAPLGNPLLYALALTWLVTIAVGLGTGFIFAGAN
jgi:hypothetical protein